MADAQRTIELIFRGIDQVSAVSDAVINNVRGFAGGVESATQPIADLTVGALQLEAGILAAGAAMTTVAVIAAGQFDSSFREIDTLVDAPVEALDGLRTSLLDYASTSTQSLEQITGATYSAISAGVDYTDSVQALTSAEQLAVAGRADLNDSMVLLVSSLNAYGEEMDSAANFSDILFTTVRQGQTTLPELAASMSNVTGTAALLDVPFSELNAALAALTTQGIPTAQATTSLNAALQAMIAPSSQAAQLASELGIEFNAQAVQANGLQATLNAVAEATGGSEEQMATLFGSTEALRAVLPLTGNAADEFAANLEAMANNTGATQRAFDEMSNAIELSSQRVQNAANVMFISFGDPLLDEFGGTANAIAEIFRAIGASAQDENGLGQLVDYIESRLGDLEQLASTIATNLPAALGQADYSGFTAGLDRIVEAFGNLFDGIDLTTVDGLTAAIELAGAAFNGLSQFVGGVIESFRPMFQYFVDLSQNLATTNPAIFEAAGNLAGFATQANLLAGGLNDLLPLVEGLLAILTVRQGIGLIGALGGAAEGASALAGRLGTAGLVGAVGAASYALGTAFRDPIQEILDGFGLTSEKIGEFIFAITASDEEIDAHLSTQAALRLALDSTRLSASGAGGSLGELPPIVDDLNRAVERVSLENLLIPADQLTRDASAVAMITREYQALSAATEEATGPNARLTAGIIGQTDALASLLIPQDMLTRSTADWSQTTIGIVPIYDQVTGAIVGYEEGIIAAGSAQDRANRAIMDSIGSINGMVPAANTAAGAVRNLADASSTFSDDVAIAFIEAGSEERVAQIEATTERIRAAYESVNVTIESTGDIISTALNLLADGDTNLRGRFDIERQLSIENDRRGEALSLQEDLTRAQLRQLEAQTAALSRGDGIITIDGSGLEPELEAFMWRILESIQVRVNEDGLGMLLGVTP